MVDRTSKIHVTQAELFEIAKVKSQGPLLKWLRENQIRFRFTGRGEKKGEVWTTIRQIDASFEGNHRESLRIG